MDRTRIACIVGVVMLFTSAHSGCTSKPAPTAAATPIPSTAPATHQSDLGLSFPELPFEIAEGRTLALAVKGAQGRGLRFRWFTKYMDEDWDWRSAWSDSPQFLFTPSKPGRYDIQVDVMGAESAATLLKKWLGTVHVQGELVKSISHAQLVTALRVGVPLHFVLNLRKDFAIEDLEFRLWDLSPTNQVVVDWRRWPLPAFRRETPGYTGLQIDVRLRNSQNTIDRRWLGDFSFSTDGPDPETHLIRSLIADDFGVMERDKAIAILSDELWLATHLMLWEFRGLAPAAQEARLAGLVDSIQAGQGSGGALRLRLRSGRDYEFNLKTRSLHQVGSPLSLDLSLDAMPAVRNVFKAVEGGTDRELLLALMTYEVHAGFHYGTSATIQNVPRLEDGVAHCADRSTLLIELLDRQGLKPRFVEVSWAESGHLLVFVLDEQNESLMLDPTVAVIYRYDPREWSQRELPKPIVLPTVYRAGIRQLDQLPRQQCSVRVFREFVEGVYPLKPKENEFSIAATEAPAP